MKRSRLEVVEQLVPEPDERHREARSASTRTRAGRRAAPVYRAAPAPGAATPQGASRQAGHSSGSSGAAMILAAVEVAVDRPSGGRRAAATRDRRPGSSPRPRACVARARRSSWRRIPAASSRRVSCSGSLQRAVDPAGSASAPKIEPIAAPFVSVSQPPGDDGADRLVERREAIHRGSDERGVVDRVHPVQRRRIARRARRRPTPTRRSPRGRTESPRRGGSARARPARPSVRGLGRGHVGERRRMGGCHEHRRVDAVRGVAEARVLPRHPRRALRVAGSRPAVRVDAQARADPLAKRVLVRRRLRRQQAEQQVAARDSLGREDAAGRQVVEPRPSRRRGS